VPAVVLHQLDVVAQYRRIRAEVGARRLEVPLADPAARFRILGPDHDNRISRNCKICGHLRQVKAPGLNVTVSPAA
jgi:hypothetical protein